MLPPTPSNPRQLCGNINYFNFVAVVPSKALCHRILVKERNEWADYYIVVPSHQMAGKWLGWLAGRETVIKSNCDHSIDHKFSSSSFPFPRIFYPITISRGDKLEFTFGSHRFNSLANGWLSRIHGMIKLFTTRRRGRKGNANDNHLHRIGN